MKQLSLLRHAKSSWEDPVERDYDRPLNGRGRRAARRMGQWMRDEGVVFDAIVASPALRTRQTIEGVEEGAGHRLAVIWDKRVYMASAANLFAAIQDIDDRIGHLLLVGHNPGIEDLVLDATRGQPSVLRAAVEAKYPTAAFATLDFAVERWTEIADGTAGIARFVRPRDLDPTLGPDD